MQKTNKLRLVQLVAVIFLTISGGPYGLEELLGSVGNHWALLLLVITPLLWDLPTVLVVLELNSLMPVNGGYYQWVKRAMGLRFAWYEGWWTWLYTFIDLAIYPVLFTEYLSYFFPDFAPFKLPVCLLIIWGSALLNIRGIVPVGKTAVILGVIVLVPFILLFFCFYSHPVAALSIAAPSLNEIKFTTFGLGIYTVMWNFLGWDNVTTYAEEVVQPVRTYLLSMGLAFALVFVLYFLVTVTAIKSGIDYKVLSEEGFPALGELISGKWLGSLVALGGMASAVGIYASVLLSVSRVPKVMADDKLLPQKLHQLHPKFNTPYISIIVCSVAVSFLVAFSFSELIIMDVIMYGAALFLEFVALIILRIKLPYINRPFKIPLKVSGLLVLFSLPVVVYLLALTGALLGSDSTLKPVIYVLCTMLSAELLWQFIIRKNPDFKTKHEVK